MNRIGEIVDLSTERIIIQFTDRSVKGYFDHDLRVLEEELGEDQSSTRIRLLGAPPFERTSVAGAKTILFVRHFEEADRENLRFHDDLQPVDCIWVRISFLDGELMEGLVRNGGSLLLHTGFFLLPLDPGSNNRLIYVFKEHLADFHVLGLRKSPRDSPLPELSRFRHAAT